jgi:hypothetical protein
MKQQILMGQLWVQHGAAIQLAPTSLISLISLTCGGYMARIVWVYRMCGSWDLATRTHLGVLPET